MAARVERLECRLLLAAVSWDGGGDGTNWNNALNWSADQVPTASDDVTIAVAGSPTIQITDARSVKSLTADESISLFAGTLTVSSPSQFNAGFSISGNGRLTGPGDVSVTGTLTWSSGFMSGTGKTVVAAGATVNLSGTALKGLTRPFYNAGTVNYSGQQLVFGQEAAVATVLNNLGGGVFNVTGDGDFLSSFNAAHAFNNAGTFTKSGSATTTTFNGVAFNNSGSATVAAGTLELAGGNSGGSSATPIQVDAGAALTFNGNFSHAPSGIAVSGAGTVNFNVGTHTFAGGQFLPTGTINFNGGTISINNSFAPAALGPISAAVYFYAPLNYGGAISILGGTAGFATDQSFSSLSFAAAGKLTGDGDVTVTGTLDWPYGYMSGTGKTIIAPGATMNLSSGSNKGLTREVDNEGTVNYSGRSLLFGQDGAIATVFKNLPGGVFNVTGDGGFFDSVNAAHAFNNAGTFTKSGMGTTTAFNGVAFNNTGSVTVASGTLQLAGGNSGGSSTTPIQVDAGAALTFAGSFSHAPSGIAIAGAGTVNFNVGTHTFAGGQFLPTGTVNFNGGTISINNSFAPAALGTIAAAVYFYGSLNYTGPMSIVGGTVGFAANESFSSLTLFGAGRLTGDGDVTITGTLDWSSGFMSGIGKTVIASGATMNLSSGSQKGLTRTIDNAGTVDYSGLNLVFGQDAAIATVLNNLTGGVFNVTGEGDFLSSFNAAHAFNNAGTFTKSGSATTTTFNGVAFNNSGSVNIVSGSLIDVGSLAFDGPNYFAGGPGAVFSLGGSLLGTTTNADQYLPQGTVSFNGSGQQLEVMGRDLGKRAAGFARNFAYGTLAVENGISLTLVDNSDNSPGPEPEALYVDRLVVAANATLNLNGLNVYANTATLLGRVINGTVNPLADGKLSRLWSSFIGGGAGDMAGGVAMDAAGNAYVVGKTDSSGWVSGGGDTTLGGVSDAYVIKISPDGLPLWSTYIGGDSTDYAYGVAVNTAGEVYLAGVTQSSGWVSGGQDTTYNGAIDGFLAKLSPTGQNLWSTYIGGTGADDVNGLALDAAGNAYVSGTTNSAGWTAGGYDTSFGAGGRDGYVAKFSPTGRSVWSTYLGGNLQDWGQGVAVDAAGSVYVVGATESSDWVSGSPDTTNDGGTDGYAVKLAPTGQHVWSTYFGGTAYDRALGVAVGRNGDLYVSGSTRSSGWTVGGYDTSFGGADDAVALRFDTVTGRQAWSTYLGGSAAEYSNGVAVTPSGDPVFVGAAGAPAPTPWTTLNPNGFGQTDGFVVRLTPDGAHVASRLFGGSAGEEVSAAAIGPTGDVYVVGETLSPDWVVDGFRTTHPPNDGDGFIVRLSGGAMSFATPASSPLPTDPVGFAVGDFNGDGVLDLVANYNAGVFPNNSSRLAVFPGSGGGRFGQPTVIDPGAGSYGTASVETADCNNDGFLDLIVTHGGTNSVGPGNLASVYLGDGNGDFSPPGTLFNVLGGAGGVAIADFNEDGKPDLAIPGNATPQIGLYFGRGDGTFVAGTPLVFGASAFGQIIATDFDLDGHVDVIVGSSESKGLKIYWGTGAGTFAGPLALNVVAPRALTVGDFNGDRRPDLAIGSNVEGVVVVLATGPRSIANPTYYPLLTGTFSLAAADFDGDGRTDLAVGSDAAGDDNVTLLRGDGSGRFGDAVLLAAGGTGAKVRAADFDGDGRPDIATTAHNGVAAMLQGAHWNQSPVLTKFFEPIPGAVTGHPFTVRYSDLLAVSDAGDRDGDSISFRIRSVLAGSFTLNGQALVPGQTLVGPGQQLVWTPPAVQVASDPSQAVPMDAMTVTLWDGKVDSGTPTTVSIAVAPPANPVNYAVLFSGGDRIEANRPIYYDNLRRLYGVLVGPRYRLDPQNIYILYADGLDPGPDRSDGVNSDMLFASAAHVSSATRNNLRSTLLSVSQRADADDHLLVWTFDHGRGTELLDTQTDDESLTGWGDGQTIRDQELRVWLRGLRPGDNATTYGVPAGYGGITTGHSTYVFGQCFSGGMLDAMTPLGPDDFGAAASNHYEESHGDYFIGAFTDALEAGYNTTTDAFRLTAVRDVRAVLGAAPNGGAWSFTAEHPWADGGSFPIFANPDTRPPELLSVAPLEIDPASTSLDVTYDMLLAASDFNDPTGQLPSFQFVTDDAGQLWRNGSPLDLRDPLQSVLSVGQTVQWRKPAGATGTVDAFDVRLVNPQRLTSEVVQVQVRIGAPVVGLMAADDFAVVREGLSGAVLDVLANDRGDRLRVARVGVATHGTVELDAPGGRVLYTPDPGFTGDDSFTYVITSGVAPAGGTGTGAEIATVQLKVARVEAGQDQWLRGQYTVTVLPPPDRWAGLPQAWGVDFLNTVPEWQDTRGGDVSDDGAVFVRVHRTDPGDGSIDYIGGTNASYLWQVGNELPYWEGVLPGATATNAFFMLLPMDKEHDGRQIFHGADVLNIDDPSALPVDRYLDPTSGFEPGFRAVGGEVFDAGTVDQLFQHLNHTLTPEPRFIYPVRNAPGDGNSGLLRALVVNRGFAGGSTGTTHAEIWALGPDLADWQKQSVVAWGTTLRSSGEGINGAGHVVGIAETVESKANGLQHAFYFDGSRMLDLGAFFAGNSTALAINRRDQVIGVSAPILRYKAGGGSDGNDFRLNRTAQVGQPNPGVGFIWQPDYLAPVPINPLSENGWSVPFDINDSGIVVGASDGKAFLWAAGTTYDLNNLVHLPGVTLISADGINNTGQIVATGVIEGGHTRAYLLDLADHVAPSVVDVSAFGSGWSNGFPPASGASPADVSAATFPWAGIDTVTIRFSEPVVIAGADLEVKGSSGKLYTTWGFDYDPNTLTARWKFPSPLSADRFALTLGSKVTDLAGSPLRAHVIPFNVLPGDVDRNGRVDAIDLARVRQRLGTSIGGALASGPRAYSQFCDVNGDGRVDARDFLLVRRLVSTRLAPAPSTILPVTAAGTVSRGATRDLFSPSQILG